MWIVTGANGFVGKHILASLPSSASARGLYRADLPSWTKEHLERALEGATGVVHSASVVHKPATPPEEYERFNVEGTRALIDAARSNGIKRFIFLSSIKIHGETPASPITEDTPVRPEADYARTKADAEKLVLAATDLNPVVLRLCPVYGRGDKGNVRTMIRAIHKRRFFVPGDGSTRKSIVHVSTIAEIVAALTSNNVTGVFVVADKHAPSIRELADAIARNLGRRRPLSIPRTVLRTTAEIVRHVAKLTHLKTPISGSLIDKSMTSSVCDPTKIERATNVVCAVDLDEKLRDEIAWLRETSQL